MVVVLVVVDVVTVGMGMGEVVSTVVFSSLLFFSARPPWYRGQHSSLCLFSPVSASPGGGTGAGVGAGAAGVGLVCWGGAGRGVGAGGGAIGIGAATVTGTGTTPSTNGSVAPRLPALSNLLPSIPKTTLLNI